MKSTVIFINLFAIYCLFLSLIKDKKKTELSLKIAAKSLFRILPIIFIIVVFIGLILGLEVLPNVVKELRSMSPLYQEKRG